MESDTTWATLLGKWCIPCSREPGGYLSKVAVVQATLGAEHFLIEEYMVNMVSPPIPGDTGWHTVVSWHRAAEETWPWFASQAEAVEALVADWEWNAALRQTRLDHHSR